MTEVEGDRIAAMVLELVDHLVTGALKAQVQGLDRNVRPEPPEATLGYMPGYVKEVA